DDAQHKGRYTVDELNKFFGSATFTGREIKPAKHSVASALPWAAAIALYSSAGCEEVCQLRPCDIRKEPGKGWIIDITAKAGPLKRKARERNIPLHPELERLGLLAYMAALPRDAKRIFPGLSNSNTKTKFGVELGRRFNKWRRALGIERQGEKLDFHSLRHTFSKAAEDVGLTPADHSRVMGHAVAGITRSVYSAPELKRVAP